MEYLTVAEFLQRHGPEGLPMDETGDTDRAGIAVALNDARGTILTYLAKDLVGPDGVLLEGEEIPERIRPSLPGVSFAIAKFNLADGAAGGEEIVTSRYKAAIATLEKLADSPDRAVVGAELVEGGGGWVGGELPGDAGADEEEW